MPALTDPYSVRVQALLREHYAPIVDWVVRRIVEGARIDVAKLQNDAERYVAWSAIVVDAAIVNLGKRGWTGTQRLLTTSANAALIEASRRPTDGGPRGMPLLLKSAFHHHALVSLLGKEKVRLVDADLEKERHVGLVVLGEARGQEIDRSAQVACRAAVPVLTNDVTVAGQRSLAITPEPLAGLSPGGRLLSSAEQLLVGYWVHSDSDLSGGSSIRVELHMLLLRDGHVARSSRSVVFSSLRDSSGTWSGSIDSISGLTPAERGQWNADGTLLTLEMNDGSAYEFRYSQSGAGMITVNTNGGARRHWVRSSI